MKEYLELAVLWSASLSGPLAANRHVLGTEARTRGAMSRVFLTLLYSNRLIFVAVSGRILMTVHTRVEIVGVGGL